eukprot:3699101-Pyramimonas_sp.AAC.1
MKWADDAMAVLEQMREGESDGEWELDTCQLEGAADLLARKPRQSVLDEGMNNGIGKQRDR